MLRNRPSLIAAVLASASILAGCGRVVPVGPAASSPAGVVPVATPNPTGLSVDGFYRLNDRVGWVISAQQVLATDDAGSTWSKLVLPGGGVARSLLAWDAAHLVVGRSDGIGAWVDRSADGGRTWQDTRLPTKYQVGAIGLVGGPSIVVAEVVVPTSANASQADLFVSADNGAFQPRRMPAAGDLSLTRNGQLWLAGGVFANQLWRSDDLGVRWTAVPLPASLGRSFSLGAPVEVGTQLILPVTLNAEASGEVLLTSADAGRTWRRLATVPVGGATGQGVALPAALAADQVVVAGAPLGRLFPVTAAGQVLPPISPNGLPAGSSAAIDQLGFVSATDGWARTQENGCRAFKSDCYSYHRLWSTRDGGQTWSPLTPG